MSNKQVIYWKKVVVICFKTVSWNSAGQAEENYTRALEF